MKPSETYADRDKYLKMLGFISYEKYLESDLWSTIRRLVYQRDGFACGTLATKCLAPLEAHHVSYRLPVLLGIDPGAIVTVCWKCHQRLEFSAGKKLSLAKVQQKTIKEFRKDNGHQFKSVPDFLRYRHNQQAHTARYIFLALRKTTWYDVIIGLLQKKKLPKMYSTYLRLS